ncbi:glycosyltransferase [Rhodoblastus acidophilus]|uniref:Chitooligosaccharide deacetylase n=1 Tax=Rhodoblastus acidophilus TaxID=1074 RepID=A0A6N8DS09_RHOAC|nr:glycosyltransferase [Rhodoblastus acidophilus]MCW2274669.1 peptidoglycan/xylan/chitin deacetylase (PgdA/CDA1 family)/GT2 family glycosyltransferase [Rhodoblastus acidophilus]MTV31624.1 glycosyltransferase [Rhodoblastus acidophilus]
MKGEQMLEHRRVPVILVYRSVQTTEQGGANSDGIAPDDFDRHIDFLTSNYRVAPLTEFIGALSSRARMEGMAAITFDGAFSNNLGAAADILRKYRAPATVFVPAGLVGRPYYWWDALASLWPKVAKLLAVQPDIRARFPDIAPNSGPDGLKSLTGRMRQLSVDEAYCLVETLAKGVGATLKNLARPANERELPKFARWPFDFGSQGVADRPLTSLTPNELQDEFDGSHRFLTERFGRPPAFFSYPYGLCERESRQAARDAGYIGAVTVCHGAESALSFRDLYELPRLDPGVHDIGDFVARLRKLDEVNGHMRRSRARSAPLAVEISPERRSLFSPLPAHEFRSLSENDKTPFRTAPIGRWWGAERGRPLDRPFIEQFIRTHAGDIRGRVLEIQAPLYSGAWARPSANIDILDIDPENKLATVVDDLQSCASIADETYDCIVLTQVIQQVPDVVSTIKSLARILRPGGVLLVTASAITQAIQISGLDFHHSFFRSGLKRLLSPYFDCPRLLTTSHGNLAIATSFLMGLAVEDVPPDLFSVDDSEYPIVVTARAMKPLPVPDEITWSDAPEAPRVSVIIPMHNAERTIKETLFSVARQSFDSFEILVVDDGSTDGSRRIAEELASRSKGRITVLQHPGGVNRGLSLTRNVAMARARGEFLVFLDSDDTIHPEKLAHDVAILDANPDVAAVVGRAIWWWDGEGEQDAYIDVVGLEPHDRIIDPPAFFNETYVLEAGIAPCVHSWMARKSCIDQIDPFDPEAMTYEDQKFLAELSLRFPIYIASACLCEYRRKESSLSVDAYASGAERIARSRFKDWVNNIRDTSPFFHNE